MCAYFVKNCIFLHIEQLVHFHFHYEWQESEQRPTKCAFGRANSGLVFQEVQLLDPFSVPMLHLFHGDKSFSRAHRGHYPIYGEDGKTKNAKYAYFQFTCKKTSKYAYFQFICKKTCKYAVTITSPC